MMIFFIYVYNFLKYRQLFPLIRSKYSEVVFDYTLSKKIPINTRVVIYGCGPYGAVAFIDLFKTNKIIAIVDKNIKVFPIITPDKISNLKFDYILVSVMNFEVQKEVECYLERLGVPKSKIVFVLYDEHIDVYKR